MAGNQFIGVGNFFDVRLIMSEVAASTNTQLARSMGRWAKTMDSKASKARDTELRKVNKVTANAARNAAISAYESSGIGDGPSYRQNDKGKLRRYSSGAMERAMRQPSFAEGDSRGIRFINKEAMDRAAAQWYRLNFGAAPRGSKNPSVGSMKFFGRASSQRAEFTGFKPSQGFKIPQGGVGFWSNTISSTSTGKFKPTRGRGKAFYIRTRKTQIISGRGIPRVQLIRNKTTNGIQGKRFLDAGAKAINETYPRLITEMIRGWERAARKSMK